MNLIVVQVEEIGNIARQRRLKRNSLICIDRGACVLVQLPVPD